MGKKQNCLKELWIEHVNRMETSRIVSNSTGVADGRPSTLKKRNKQNCLKHLWLEHVNRMETNRIA